VAGHEIFVHGYRAASHALFGFAQPVDVEIEVRYPFERVRVRPLGAGVSARVEGTTVSLCIERPCNLSIECDDEMRRPLFLFACGIDEGPPPGTAHVFRAGMIELADGGSIYIEAGAVVRGAVHARGARGVSIAGHGIFDGSAWPRHEGAGRQRLLVFEDCRDVRIEGITVVDSPSWTMPSFGCEGVLVRDVRIVSDNASDDASDDGIDIVGCRNVEIDRCFVRTKDDCVAVKASTQRHECGGRDVENVLVRRSTFWNGAWGNALEIGYETQCDRMRSIVFRDCDIIHCEREGYGSGGCLTIHNGDRADIGGVLYEDIRVEDAREKLVDFKVLDARYTRDEQKGFVHDVVCRDVRVVDGPPPVSIIQGMEDPHQIVDIAFEGLEILGQPVDNAADARIVLEMTRKVLFRRRGGQ
jgi:hypothetical protein